MPLMRAYWALPVRKVKEGETTNDLFAFLTTEPNNRVGVIHPKAMPVILTKPNRTAGFDRPFAASVMGRVNHKLYVYGPSVAEYETGRIDTNVSLKTLGNVAQK
jgi:hypothetical protein